MGEAVNSVKEHVAEKAGEVKEAFDKSPVGQIVGNIKEGVEDIAGTIAETHEKNQEVRNEVINNVKEAVAEKANAVKEAVQQKAEEVRERREARHEAMREAVDTVKEHVSEKVGEIRDGVHAAGEAVAEKANEAKEAFEKSPAGQILGNIKEGVEDIGNTIAETHAKNQEVRHEVLNNVKEAVSEKFGEVKEAVEQRVEADRERRAEVAEHVKDGIATVAGGVLAAGQAVGDGIQAAGEAVHNKVQAVGQGIADGVHAAGEAIHNKAEEVKEGVQAAGQAVAEKAGQVKEAFDNTPVGKIVNNDIEAAKDIIGTVAGVHEENAAVVADAIGELSQAKAEKAEMNEARERMSQFFDAKTGITTIDEDTQQLLDRYVNIMEMKQKRADGDPLVSGVKIALDETKLSRDLKEAGLNYSDMEALNEYRVIDDLVQTQVDARRELAENGGMAGAERALEVVAALNECCQALGPDVGLILEELSEMANNREAAEAEDRSAGMNAARENMSKFFDANTGITEIDESTQGLLDRYYEVMEMREQLGAVSGSEAEELSAVIADAEAMLDEDLFASNLNYYDLDALNEYKAIDELVQTQAETGLAVKEAGDFATMKQLVDEGTAIVNEGCRVLGEDVGLTFEEVCEMARNREALGYYG